jgi:restriction endonuclease S subunit
MSKELKAMALGSSTMPLLNKSDFEQIAITMPPIESLREFSKLTYVGNNMIILKMKENSKLTELQSLLLAKMGR